MTATSARPFYRTRIVVTVLSATPLENDIDLAAIANSIDSGDDVGTVLIGESRRISGIQMANALTRAGSEPGFLMLDSRGRDVE